MKKLKDLIYDYNDVFVALIIVVLAAGVLVWRVNVVMDYPNQTASANHGKEIDVNFEDVNLNQEEIDPIVDPDYEETPITTGPAVVDPPVDNPPVEDPPVVNPPEPQVKKYTLVISSENKNTNWTAVANELKKNGIIKEDDNLGRKATELKVDGKLQKGTYELTSDMSLEEIANTITKQ